VSSEALCLRGGTLVTCNAAGDVLRGDLLIQQGRITRLGRVAKQSHVNDVDARGCALLPGFVMTHVHLCQTLMRGLASDLPLLEWLRTRVWPLEAAHDANSLRTSADLGLLELLRAGVTTLLDLGTVRHYDVVFEAALAAGVRLHGGKALMDCGDGVPRALRETTRDALASAEALAATWSNHPSGRVRNVWIPRFILSCSEALVRGAAERATSRGELMHTHAAEHPNEARVVRERFGKSDVLTLRDWGLRGPRASLAHGVQLTQRDVRALVRDGTRLVHCPSANLKLGSGIAQVAALRSAGLVIGLGPDGAPCNDNLDPWLELRHAALLSSARAEPGALRAQDVLSLATLEGAKLLGLEHEIGSLEVGKRADVVVVRLDGVGVTPAPDPVSALVYACQSRDVTHVLADGRFLVRDGAHALLDETRILARARLEARRLRERAGV
jgi:cytosine/adenosine deaminase-related metal-dependent hydrolase